MLEEKKLVKEKKAHTLYSFTPYRLLEVRKDTAERDRQREETVIASEVQN